MPRLENQTFQSRALYNFGIVLGLRLSKVAVFSANYLLGTFLQKVDGFGTLFCHQ